MDDNINDQRKANRERLHDLWKIARTGDLESLSGEERRLAEIILEHKDPIEALQFYNSMRKNKVSRHDTIHLIGAILTPLILDDMRHKIPFDKRPVPAGLKKYKAKKPARIYESLEKKPSS